MYNIKKGEQLLLAGENTKLHAAKKHLKSEWKVYFKSQGLEDSLRIIKIHQGKECEASLNFLWEGRRKLLS